MGLGAQGACAGQEKWRVRDRALARARVRAHPRASLFLGYACPMASGAAAAPGSTHAKGSEGDGPTVGAAIGAGTVRATPLSAAPDLVTSCSATDQPVELDGGPGGSDAVDAITRCVNRPAGPSWHGLARCGGWHGLLTCDGSTAQAAPQQRRGAR
eukprot:scaffold48462_cov60-Phaeocystis_antarctica.AAC.4